ncbi:IclR family transcriptional regulator [Amorphus sp. 3PC139-8]|uniref:IclR family transcriptional regulator n=1 Tax=Amorphus sp. 3PC139-8 TaxID=2735676 RepID=UPI00345D7028
MMSILESTDVDPETDDAAASGSPGVRSVEVGLSLLPLMLAAEAPMSLTALAQASGMAPPKVHRYMASLVRSGLVARDPASGGYDLGPMAVSIGLSALGRLDPESLGRDAIRTLAQRLDETALLAVFANRGATVVAVEAATHSVFMAVRVGSVLSATRSATGRAFLAFHDDPAVRLAAEKEIGRDDLASLIGDIRAAGIAWTRDELLEGISAVAAPVFDHDGRVIQVLTVLGSSPSFDVSPYGPAARAARAEAEAISRSLGFYR